MIRLLLADSNTLFRKALTQLFNHLGEVVVTGEASTGGEVLAAVRRSAYDVLLLEADLPGISGAELIGRIRCANPTLPILVMSIEDQPDFAKRKLQAGASGFLSKDCEPHDLIEAVRRVAAGGRFLSPRIAEKIAFESDDDSSRSLHQKLTNREFQILRLLVKGMSLNQIAETLSISDKTVSTHKARLMKKLGVVNNAQLFAYAVTNGLAR